MYNNRTHLFHRTTFTILISRFENLSCTLCVKHDMIREYISRAKKNVAGSFTNKHDISQLRRSIETIVWLLERCTDSDDQDGACEVTVDTYNIAKHHAITHAILTYLSFATMACVVLKRWRRRERIRATRKKTRRSRNVSLSDTGTVDPRRSSFYAGSAHSCCSRSICILPSHLYYLRPNSLFSCTQHEHLRHRFVICEGLNTNRTISF